MPHNVQGTVPRKARKKCKIGVFLYKTFKSFNRTNKLDRNWEKVCPSLMTSPPPFQRRVRVTKMSIASIGHRHIRGTSQLFYQPTAKINFQSKALSIMSPVTDCLELSVSSYQQTLSRHIWKLNYCIVTRSNISSAAGASDSNSRHTAPPTA